VDETGAVGFLKKAILMKKLSITEPILFDAVTETSYFPKYERKNCDKMLEALIDNAHLREINSDLEVSVETLETLNRSKWWKNISRLRLTVRKPDFENYDFSKLRMAFRDFGNLTDLDLKLENFDSEWKEINYEVATNSRHKNLKSLTLHDCHHFYEEGGEEFPDFEFEDFVRTKKETLEVFKFKSYEPTDFTNLQFCKNLKVLEMSCSFNALESLAFLKNLTTLEVKFNGHEQDKMYPPPSCLPNLKFLKVSLETDDYCRLLNDKHPEWLLISLISTCPNVRRLEVHKIKCSRKIPMTPACIAEIAEKCLMLEDLTFDWRWENINIDHLEGNITDKLTRLKFLQLKGWNFSRRVSQRLIKNCSKLIRIQNGGDLFVKAGASVEQVVKGYLTTTYTSNSPLNFEKIKIV
jgi:hypothetical protein